METAAHGVPPDGRAPGAAFDVQPLAADAYSIRPPAVLDAFTAPDLDGLLRELATRGARRLVVDLSEATLIDSSGLGALLSGYIQLRERGGALELIPGCREVMRAFELTGLDRVFTGAAGVA